jgi:hypothetical protein
VAGGRGKGGEGVITVANGQGRPPGPLRGSHVS